MIRRILLPVLLLTLCGMAVAPSAFGAALQFDRIGHVKGQPDSTVGFNIERFKGRLQITNFTLIGVDYTCSDAPDGKSQGWTFDRKLRVKSRRFGGKGEWVGLPLDPVGRVGGRLRKKGVATGSLTIRGELGGAGTHCNAGKVAWRATRRPT